MINQITGTTVSRILITISGLGVLMLNTRYLGAEKIGVLAVYLIYINLVLHLSEIVGGSSMVYLQKKYASKGILSFSYLWALTISLFALFIFSYFSMIDESIMLLVLISGFVQAMSHANLHLLVGKEKIRAYNQTTFLGAIIILIGLSLSYLQFEMISVRQFLVIYTISQITTFITSLYFLSHDLINETKTSPIQSMYKELFNYGLVIQLANLFQFGVYRSNYLVLEHFSSASILGVYSIGNQVGEKALIPGNAVSLVQYSTISNSDDLEYSVKLTIQLSNLNTLLSIGSFTALLCIPADWLSYILGPDFTQIKSILFYLAPGIVFLSISSVFSHFFAGLGKYSINTKISGLGFISILIFSYLLIPTYGIEGAAISASIVYLVQLITNVLVFKKISNLNWDKIFNIFIRTFQKYSIKNLK
ncbi:MAG: polysaccharide biosynthesis C-terminal domain-containing protein [Salibacteraceae bacterium]